MQGCPPPPPPPPPPHPPPPRGGRGGRPPPPPPLIHSRRSGAFAKPPRRSWPPDRWDPLLVRHGMPRSSPRKADLQPGLRSWAYDLPQRAGASSGAPKRWLAADAATFASIYAELPPEERHAYEVLEASRGCHLYFDLDGRRGGAPGSMACEPPCPRPSPSHPVTCDRAPEQPGEDTARCVAEEAAGVLRDLIAAQAPADVANSVVIETLTIESAHGGDKFSQHVLLQAVRSGGC